MAPIPTSPLPQSNSLESSIYAILPRSPALRDTITRRATIAFSNSILQLVGRQNNDPSNIPTTYGSINSGPSPGTVVGIVLGSVGGFLLLLWLIYTCLNFGTVSSRSSYTDSVVIRAKRKSRGSTHSRRASETIEIQRDRSPIRIVRESSVRTPERVERVIVEESRQTRRERDVSLDRSLSSDEVVVIEEHSPPRRKKSSRREEERTGYRTVDPVAFAGVVGGRTSRR
jgi:hypothetical protein